MFKRNFFVVALFCCSCMSLFSSMQRNKSYRLNLEQFGDSRPPCTQERWKKRSLNLLSGKEKVLFENILYGKASFWREAEEQCKNINLVDLLVRSLEEENNFGKREREYSRKFVRFSLNGKDRQEKLKLTLDYVSGSIQWNNQDYSYKEILNGTLFLHRANSFAQQIAQESKESTPSALYFDKVGKRFNKIAGALCGLTCGDVYGQGHEFFENFNFNNNMAGNIHLSDFSGEDEKEIAFSDDTRMGLIAALGNLIHKNHPALDFQKILMKLYYADSFNEKDGWMAQARNAGKACTAAKFNFQKILENDNSILYDELTNAGKEGGNGALMRAAAYAFEDNLEDALQKALSDGYLTHRDPVSTAAIYAFVTVLWTIIHREEDDKAKLVDFMIETSKKYEQKIPEKDYKYNSQGGAGHVVLDEKSLEYGEEDKKDYYRVYPLLKYARSVAEEYNKRDESEKNFENLFRYAQEKLKIPGKGKKDNFDGQSARTALAWVVFAFLTASNYAEAMMLLANIYPAKDTDTLASICGALYGAFEGFVRIQEQTDFGNYIDKIEEGRNIIKIATLYALFSSKGI